MYVDGFIVPVPKEKLPDYLRMAKLGSKVWMEHGALSYHECVGDDVPVGKWTSFPRSVKLKEGEVVIFSWITYKSKAQRDRIMKKVMSDPRFDDYKDPKKMPFDGKRMIFGGFKAVISR